MKRIINSLHIMSVLFLAVVAFNPMARAQAYADGSFVLPYQVEWQGKLLPAGHYTFTVEEGIPRDLIKIRCGRVNMMIQGADVETFSGKSVLSIITLDGKGYVQSVGIAPIHTEFVFQMPKAGGRAFANTRASIQVIAIHAVR